MKVKNDMASSSGVTLKEAESSENISIPADMPLVLSRNKDNLESDSVTNLSMQSDSKALEKDDTNLEGKDSDNLNFLNQEVAQPANKPKKKRKRRKKSTTDASKTDEPDAEIEKNKPDTPEQVLRSPECQRALVERITAIESGKTKQASLKLVRQVKVKSPGNRKEEKELALIIEDEIEIKSKDKTQVFGSANRSNTKDSMKSIEEEVDISSALTPIKTRKKDTLENPPQNMLQKELEARDNVKSESINVTKPFLPEKAKTEKKNATGKDSDSSASLNREAKLSAEKLKKGKSPPKSVPSASEKESSACAEYEGHKLDISATNFDKDADWREYFKTPVSIINSLVNEPKMSCKGKRNFDIEDEYADKSSKIQLDPSDDETKTTRPVIFVTNKFTQTDLIQEPSNIPLLTCKINNSELNFDSDSTVVAGAALSEVLLTVEEPNLELNQEHSNIPKHTEIKINSAMNSDSDLTIRAEAAVSELLLRPEELNLENISGEFDVQELFRSNSSSIDPVLRSIRDDFLRDFKSVNEKFKEDFINCFKNEK